MRLTAALIISAIAISPASAEDMLNVKQISLELAQDIAARAVSNCREAGYQVSAVVVDRSGYPQVVLRDAFASRFTVEIAEKKANAVILSGVPSSTFRHNRGDIRMEMNNVTGILVLEGAVPIRSSGALLGAVGVSGAPGGDKDEACAVAAVESVQERLEFTE